MTVERYGSKTDVIVKLVLVFFIALLSFSIGTFVGKKFSDNQYKLAQLEPEAHGDAHASADAHGETRAVASVDEHGNHGESKQGESLSDEEIAKLAEEFISDDDVSSELPKAPVAGVHGDSHEAPAAAHATAAAPAHDSHAAAPVAKVEHKADAHGAPVAKVEAKKETAAVKAQPLQAAQRVADGKTAGESKPVVQQQPTSRIPTSLPKEVAASAIGKYTVQVGSYQTEKEAQKISADLKEKGFSAFYVSASIKGQKWFRVSVGLFATQKEANAYKADLLARSKVTSAIVQKVTSAE